MFNFFHQNKHPATVINPAKTQTITIQTPPNYVSSDPIQHYPSQAQVTNFTKTGNFINNQNSAPVQTQAQNNFQTQHRNKTTIVNSFTGFATSNPVSRVSIPVTSVTSTTSNPSLSISDEEADTFVMIDNLVMAILGYSIVDIPESQREQVIKECLSIFSDYITTFVEMKYGIADATRLKASQKFADKSVFSKFTELGSKFDEAYSSFLEVLEKKWNPPVAQFGEL